MEIFYAKKHRQKLFVVWLYGAVLFNDLVIIANR